MTTTGTVVKLWGIARVFGRTPIGLAVGIGSTLLTAVLVHRLGWALAKALPWLLWNITFGICVFVLLPLCVFRKTRPWAGTGFVIASYAFGLVLFTFSCIVAFAIWGYTGLFIGVVFFGLVFFALGVVPVALLATLLHGEWLLLLNIVLAVVCAFGTHFLGIYLASKKQPHESGVNDDTGQHSLEDETRQVNSEDRKAAGVEAFTKGEDFFSKGQMPEALECFDEAIECGYVDNADVYLRRGSCLQSLDYDLDAIDDFDSAIALEPENSITFHQRSISRTATSDLRGCISDLVEAIRLAEIDNKCTSGLDTHAREIGHKDLAHYYRSQLAFAKIRLDGFEGSLREYHEKRANRRRRGMKR